MVVFFTFAFAASNSAIAEKTQVIVTEENQKMLEGEWAGIWEKYSAGMLEWSAPASLNIRNDEALFSSDAKEWNAKILIKDGKVLMDFGYGTRKGTVYKTENGLEMKIEYDSTWRGWSNKNYIELKKK